MERVRLALRISKIYCKRIERVNASKSFKRFFCEAGFGGGGGVGGWEGILGLLRTKLFPDQ